jgi:hypothetical protein
MTLYLGYFLSLYGAIAIEDSPNKGRLRLYYEDNNGTATELTGKILLYELY